MSKKKRKGRGINHGWRFGEYKGDIAIYAICPDCRFIYACDKEKYRGGIPRVPAPEKLYPYCPLCGARKTWYEEEVEKIDMYPWEYRKR